MGTGRYRDRLLTHREAAELLGLSETALLKHRLQGRIPFVRLPGTRIVRYSEASLMQLIHESEVPATTRGIKLKQGA